MRLQAPSARARETAKVEADCSFKAAKNYGAIKMALKSVRSGHPKDKSSLGVIGLLFVVLLLLGCSNHVYVISSKSAFIGGYISDFVLSFFTDCRVIDSVGEKH